MLREVSNLPVPREWVDPVTQARAREGQLLVGCCGVLCSYSRGSRLHLRSLPLPCTDLARTHQRPARPDA